MEWTRQDDETAFVEWIREDGYATIRRRQRADGGYVVRYDRLFQAPEGGGYHRARVDDLETANELIKSWKQADPIE